jgi:hypothetical protein
MPRREFDSIGKYLIQQQGQGILLLGEALGVRLCHPLQAEFVQPRRLPDGLLDVFFHGRQEPDRFLIELATYPRKRVLQQALDDLTLARMHFRQLPELLIVVLQPGRRSHVPLRYVQRSRLGWSSLAGAWKVVELWTLAAERLLAAGDVGVVPWVPLMRFDGPPEELLECCRERIEAQAHPHDRANLLAVSQVLAQLKFPQPELLALLGGSEVMIESPLINELVAKARQEDIVEILKDRFQKVPGDIVTRLHAVVKERKLKELLRLAWRCPDLEAFRERLLS